MSLRIVNAMRSIATSVFGLPLITARKSAIIRKPAFQAISTGDPCSRAVVIRFAVTSAMATSPEASRSRTCVPVCQKTSSSLIESSLRLARSRSSGISWSIGTPSREAPT